MKAQRNYLVAVALLGLLLALPCRVAAAPGQSFHFKFTGLMANASFDNFDETGCVEASAGLQATNGRTKMVGGGPEATSSVQVQVLLIDNCGGLFVVAFGSATLPPGAFQIDKKLASATLNTSVDVSNPLSGSTFPVKISLTWAATGEPTVSRDHTLFRAPGLRSNSTFAGILRAATASGSVTAIGITFSPSPTTSAGLFSVKQGDLEVYQRSK